MNLVAFVHCDAERDVAGLVGDSIEHDELYPYQSSCRIRRDVSPTIIVRKAAQSPKGEPVVIIQRLAFTKVHRPASPELLEGFEQVCASTAAVVDTMLSNVQELLRVAPTS
ncbi:TPA: hypothetical protein N0F65_010847 [Lagenidium giganteum]|uniref:Uncharacterized protein n=1 Tax=Lagenidium giganteum TaxID=4803 RepID=A0AAV2Z682_9STRA|nr:TPA: hypothetical protein N0F65_010847 [Lagenidium giganteum]